MLELKRGNEAYDLEKGVECVKYNPHNQDQIASCQRNGNFRIWDKRMQLTPIFEFNAHYGSALYLDWHPSKPNIIISGG